MNEFSSMDPAGGSFFAAYGFIWFIFAVVMIIGTWKIYMKAGQPGWASIIPIYNIVILLKIVNKPLIWLLWLCIPFVNIYFGVVMMHRLSVSFGKDTGFTVGLILIPIVFIPILGFDKSVYQRIPDGVEATFN